MLFWTRLMIASNTYTSKSKSKKKEKSEDLSKNHRRKVRYLLRLQQETEAVEELKTYGQKPSDQLS